MGAAPLGSHGYQNLAYPGQSTGAAGIGSPADFIFSSPGLANPESCHAGQGSIQRYLAQTCQASKPKKHGFFQKVGDFFKGIGNGVKHIAQSLLNPKNWLMIGGIIALCIFFPPIGAVLAGFGAVMAGSQMMKGMAKDNWEQVGEGTLNLGLSVFGFKATTGGVKADGSKFTLCGTRSAESEARLSQAEMELTRLKKGNADNSEVEQAEGVVEDARQAQQSALENQARMETARMNFFTKLNFLRETETTDLSVTEVQLKVVESTDDVALARSQAQDAKTALDDAILFGDDDLIAQAESNNYEAQRTLDQAMEDNLEMLKAQRIKQLQEADFQQRMRIYASNGWATLKDSARTFSGKTFTDSNGRTVTYWRRSPRNPSNNPLKIFRQNASMHAVAKNWWTPNTTGSQPPERSPQDMNDHALPKVGHVSLPTNTQNSNQSDSVQSKPLSTTDAAQAGQKAIASRFKTWEAYQPSQQIASSSWDNKYSMLVPLSENNDYGQKNNADDPSPGDELLCFYNPCDTSQFNFELPA